MSQSGGASVTVVSPPAPDASETSLNGRALLLARVGWVALTLLVLTLNAIAIPKEDALLQTVCQPGAVCINSWTPAQVSQLQQSGLSLGFLAAYQVGWDVGTVLIYSALATLIFWRRSADRMALFCAYMLVLFGGATYTSLLDLGLRTVAPAWYWLVGALELLAQVSVPTFFLLFPSGRFVPRWTRWGVMVFGLYEVWYVFFSNAYIGKFGALGSLVFAILLLGLVGLQISRYRRVSTFRERQQTKWVVFGFTIAMGGFALFLISANLALSPGLRNAPGARVLFPTTVTYGLLLVVPISIAIAVLRSQLWDIDVIIRRTLIYGALTAILAAVYFGVVFGAQAVVLAVTGQRGQQPVVIVASTLLIATLFNPLRRLLQAFIDRRFYRRKYDGARTLSAFSATLRAETDLTQLSDQLLAVARETMQPAHVSLWLRQPERQPTGQSHRLESRRQLLTTPNPN